MLFPCPYSCGPYPGDIERHGTGISWTWLDKELADNAKQLDSPTASLHQALTSGYAPPAPKSAAALGFHPLRAPYLGMCDEVATGSDGPTSSTSTADVCSGAGNALL